MSLEHEFFPFYPYVVMTNPDPETWLSVRRLFKVIGAMFEIRSSSYIFRESLPFPSLFITLPNNGTLQMEKEPAITQFCVGNSSDSVKESRGGLNIDGRIMHLKAFMGCTLLLHISLLTERQVSLVPPIFFCQSNPTSSSLILCLY